MQAYHYLIIGGGLAGGSAVDVIRQIDAEGSLALVTQEPHRPYQRPPLSKEFLTGKAGQDKVYLRPADHYAGNNVDLLLGVRATGLDPDTRMVTLDDGRQLKYERLLLATGASTRRLAIPGSHLPGVFTLRTIEDSKGIHQAAGQGKRALVIGGSFIGSEVASSLAQLGTQVILVFPEGRLLARIAPLDLSQSLQVMYKDNGVRLLPGTSVERLEGRDAVEEAVLDNGETLDVDLVVMGVGVNLDTDLARQAGLEMDDRGAVLVDDTLRTSDSNIYAAGDIAVWPDPTYGRRLRVEHWNVAKTQGVRAGRNMAGEVEPYKTLPYFFSDLFDLSLEVWGDLSNWDRTVLRGSTERANYTYFYFDGDRLTGVLAVNCPNAERTPLRNLVKARPAFADVADDLQDERVDLTQLAGEMQVEKKPAAQTGAEESGQEVTFERDIRPLFRKKDVDEMIDISGWDLSNYQDVKERALDIYATLVDGSMPCDEAWSKERVELFKRWMDQGKKP